MSIEPGTLYVVATPIGNLGDVSERARQVLAGVDLILAEDTRHSQKLLTHLGIRRPLESLHEHNERGRIAAVQGRLEAGQSLALISDAGTPLISDPGYPLVRALRQSQHKVIPVPGPCSVVAALSVAGLPTDRFVFEGFLPAKPAARRRHLDALAQEPRTLVFLESGQRLAGCLDDLAGALGPQREAVLARELSKRYEQVHGDTLQALGPWLAAAPQRGRGEFVLVVAGAPDPDPDPETLPPEAERWLRLLLAELPPARAAALVARALGLRRQSVYAAAERLRED